MKVPVGASKWWRHVPSPKLVSLMDTSNLNLAGSLKRNPTQTQLNFEGRNESCKRKEILTAWHSTPAVKLRNPLDWVTIMELLQGLFLISKLWWGPSLHTNLQVCRVDLFTIRPLLISLKFTVSTATRLILTHHKAGTFWPTQRRKAQVTATHPSPLLRTMSTWPSSLDGQTRSDRERNRYKLTKYNLNLKLAHFNG